jgi:hypothetical protein
MKNLADNNPVSLHDNERQSLAVTSDVWVARGRFRLSCAAVATSREGRRSPRSGIAALASKALIIFNFRSPSASIDVLTHVPRGAA